jgi:tetratricopeptide (TPR) repeat protein
MPDLASIETAAAHFNHADMLRRLGQAEEALVFYDRAIALRPNWAVPHLDRGALLADQGKHSAAIGSFRRVTRIEPGLAQGWSNLGNALSALGRHKEAIASLRRAVNADRGSAVTHYNLGNALSAAGALAEAVQAFTRAIAIDPQLAAAAVNLSARLRDLGESDGALCAAQLATHVAPGLAAAQMALGCAQYDLGAFGAAEIALRRACELDPAPANAHANLGLVLAALGRFPEALRSYDAALAQQGGHAQALFGRAAALLAMGDYAQGWPAFACRARMPDADRRGFAQPAWRGDEVPGRTLLLHAEQGYGDTLQFLRFVPQAAARSGARIVLEVQPALKRLCACLPGVAVVIARGEKLPQVDLHTPLLDLAALFAPSLDALAPAAPYLRADPSAVFPWTPPPGEGPLTGLVWAGQSRPDQPHALAMDRRRSMGLADFAPLAARAARFVSLQSGAPASELRHAPSGLRIDNPMGRVRDFADTASIIARLDLVISVDTSTAHLAAGMGKPVWLLTRADACWRWLRGREDSPWYPSMRLFRQPAPGDWRSVVADIASALPQR